MTSASSSAASSATPTVVVFDVNETLSDMTPMAAVISRRSCSFSNPVSRRDFLTL
jgi:hypothetical protein